MSLSSKKAVDLRRYAKALGIHVGFSDEDGQHYKKKSVLLREINDKVNESGDTLRHDWKNTLATCIRSSTKTLIDRPTEHSQKLGIHPSHRIMDNYQPTSHWLMKSNVC